MTPEELFLANVAIIKRVVQDVARRNHLDADTRDELGGIVHLKLIENDYEVFRQYQGRCSIRTYLTVVIGRIFLDYRNEQWGKWRPSAAARRLGPLAMKLEMLMMRDRMTFDEAHQVLRTSHGFDTSRAALDEILRQLPRRASRRFVTDDVLETIPAPAVDVEHAAQVSESDKTARRIADVLAKVVAELPADDRLILKLQYFDGLTVAQIARSLELQQKPLYRRLSGVLERLRASLVAEGVDPQEVLDFLGVSHLEIEIDEWSAPRRASPGNTAPGPSLLGRGERCRGIEGVE